MLGFPTPRPRGRRTARLVPALLLLAASPARLAAQPAAPIDDAVPARFATIAAAARTVFERDHGALWSARLDTIPWFGVHRGRVYLTADPQRPGYQRDGALWSGPLPDGVNPANSALDWAGRRWAMVLLPLPTDSLAAVRLLLHEATHVAQPSVLPLPRYLEGGAGGAQLDGVEGRVWLQLEWRALARALDATAGRTGVEADAAADALLFRARRYLDADAGERTRQRALDLVEGLPEYTAWRLTAGAGAASSVAASIRRDAPAIRSFERGFPYFTGPAYALLLDRRAGAGWRSRVAAAPDLQRLLLATLPAAPAALRVALADDAPSDVEADALRRLADAAGRRYEADVLRDAERRRWAARERELAARRARFVDAPTLRLRQPGGMRVTFDQNAQASLGDAGTVMANLVWTGADGAELRAPAGALVATDWQELRVPLGAVRLEPGRLTRRTEWQGDGWTLVLPPGWTIEAAGASRVLRPPPR